MTALTDFAENKIIDALFRAQALAAPTTWYIALVTAGGSDSAAGTEVTGGSYARQAVAASLTTFAGTQGGTAVSSGTNGTTSNLAVITYPAPTAAWGSVAGIEFWDALTSGNRWAYGPLGTAKTVNNGDPAPTIAIAGATFQIDT